MPWMALAFLGGVVCLETRDVLSIEALVASPLCALALSCAFLRPALVLALLAGSGWAAWHAAIILDRDLDLSREGRDLLVSGEIVSLPATREARVQFDFAPEDDALPRADPPDVVRRPARSAGR